MGRHAFYVLMPCSEPARPHGPRNGISRELRSGSRRRWPKSFKEKTASQDTSSRPRRPAGETAVQNKATPAKRWMKPSESRQSRPCLFYSPCFFPLAETRAHKGGIIYYASHNGVALIIGPCNGPLSLFAESALALASRSQSGNNPQSSPE